MIRLFFFSAVFFWPMLGSSCPLILIGVNHEGARRQGFREDFNLHFEQVEADATPEWSDDSEFNRMLANLQSAGIPIQRFAVHGTLKATSGLYEFGMPFGPEANGGPEVAYGNVSRIREVRTYVENRTPVLSIDRSAVQFFGADLNIADIDSEAYLKKVPRSLDNAVEGFLYLPRRRMVATFHPKGIGSFLLRPLDPDAGGVPPLPLVFKWESN